MSIKQTLKTITRETHSAWPYKDIYKSINGRNNRRAYNTCTHRLHGKSNGPERHIWTSGFLWLPIKCVHVMDTCASVSSHSQIQLITWGDYWEMSPKKRWAWAQVADGRRSQVDTPVISVCVCGRILHSRTVLRQSRTANTLELLFCHLPLINEAQSCGLMRGNVCW